MKTNRELSILIPSRQEMFLAKTIQDILSNIEADTEIIVVLDGAWAEPQIPQHERVTIVYLPVSIGQRAATNLACRIAKGKYVMKTDAHCAFDKGFDRKMIARMQDNYTMIPMMYNLWAFDWVCKDGHKRYQSPSGSCHECGKETKREIVFKKDAEPGSTGYKNWKNHSSAPRSVSYCFDSEAHFQYNGQYTKRPEFQEALKTGLTETMSIQGSCFMVTREKYLELDLCDESFGSWGNQGVEVACKTWLSGGRVVVNHDTWYAHLFRTQGGDFSFPYEQPGNQVAHTKKQVKDLFFNNRWEKQIHPISWLLEKFWPVNGWTDEDLNKLRKIKTPGVVYISDVRLDQSLLKKCQDKLREAFKGRIVSVTLKPVDFGENIVLPLKREKISIFKQILAGLEALDTDYVFLCDDDCLYDSSHFDFTPPRDDVFYYDMNWWRVRTTDGFSVHWDGKQSNLLCANRQLLVNEYRERVRKVEAEGWHKGGYEPGTRSLKRGGFSDSPSEVYHAKNPSLDLRHGRNLTGDKWKKEDFRDPKYRVGWGERFDKSWKESLIVT